jgi:hypothetical protein
MKLMKSLVFLSMSLFILAGGLSGCSQPDNPQEQLGEVNGIEAEQGSSEDPFSRATGQLPKKNTPPIAWATSEGAVLVRWFGREAAGLPPFFANSDQNLASVLPGSPGTPEILIERRLLPDGAFGVIHPGVSRMTDQVQIQEIIGQAPWWDGLVSYINESMAASGMPIIEPELLTTATVFEFFDANPMAAEYWSSIHHEIAMLLGTGFYDQTAALGQKVQYRLSFATGASQGTPLGLTGELTVGVAITQKPTVRATSNPVQLFGQAATIDPSETTDVHWLSSQGQRRLASDFIYVGWDYPLEIAPNTQPVFGYELYRTPVNGNLDATGDPEKVNDLVIIPGGSTPDWIASNNSGPIQPVGFQNGELISNPVTPSMQGNDAALFFFRDLRPEQQAKASQTYCYSALPVDYLGNQSATISGEFTSTQCAQFRNYSPPPSPTGLQAEIYSEEIRLSWDSVPEADHYSVYRASTEQGQPMPASPGEWEDVTADGAWSAAGGITFFLDASAASVALSDDQERDYWYRARTWNSGGERSALSMPVFAFIRDSLPPGQPSIGAPRDEKLPPVSESGGPCIEITIDPNDTDYVQIYRKIGENEYVLVATIPVADLDVGYWCDPSLDSGDMDGSVEYVLQAHDDDGNYSWSDPFAIPFFNPDSFGNPVITSVERIPNANNQLLNTVVWIGDAYPQPDTFGIYRTDLTEHRFFLSEVAFDTENLIDGGIYQAKFSHEVSAADDIFGNYEYVVSARKYDAESQDLLIETFSDPFAMSHATQIPDFSNRELGLLRWCLQPQVVDDQSVELNWDFWAYDTPANKSIADFCSPTLSDEKLPSARTIEDFAYLIFRSRHENSGYVQIAPVLGWNANSLYGAISEPQITSGIPNVQRGIAFVDREATHGTYWYVVVAIDATTGEAQFTTSAAKVSRPSLPVIEDKARPTNQKCNPARPTKLTTRSGSKMAPNTLVFGSGGDHSIQVIVCAWKNTSPIGETGTFLASGTGYAVLNSPDGRTHYVGLKFLEITAKYNGVVLSGEATADYPKIVVKSANTLTYSVEGISVLAPSGLSAIINVGIDDALIFVTGANRSRSINLGNVSISNKLNFKVLKSQPGQLPEVLNNPLVPLGTLGQNPAWFFLHETLPIAFVPQDMTISGDAIVAGEVIARYFERWNGIGLHGAVDRAWPTKTPNAADALLQSSAFTASSFEINRSGLQADLQSIGQVTGTFSIPFGLTLSSAEMEFRIAGSQVVSGSLGAGTASTSYLSTPSLAPNPPQNGTSTLEVEFDELGLDKLLAIEGRTTTQNEIAWLQTGFTIPANAHDKMTLYVAPVVSFGEPAASTEGEAKLALLQPVIQGLDVGNVRFVHDDGSNSLWSGSRGSLDDADAFLRRLSPGINVRGNPSVLWNCVNSNFATNSYLYLRQSGLTNALKLVIGEAGQNVSVAGYPTVLNRADFLMHSTDINSHKVLADINIPYPGNFLFSGKVDAFDEQGCISTMGAKNGLQELHADYWNLDMSASQVEFRDIPNTGKRLVLHAGVDLPHLASASNPTNHLTATESQWEPSGNSGGVSLDESPGQRFENLSFIPVGSEGIQLRNPNDPQPELDASANTTDLNCVDCAGWITYKGELSVPFFGPLSEDGEGQQIAVSLNVFTDHANTIEACQNCADYIGTAGLYASEIWVSEAGLELKYPLVITREALGNSPGMKLNGFDRLSILPIDALEVIALDTAVVIDSKLTEQNNQVQTSIFLGLSSIPAIVKSTADALNIAPNAEPTPDQIQRWFGRFLSESPTLTESDLALYSNEGNPVQGLDDCPGVLSQIWSTGEWTYRETLDVVDQAVLEGSGCFGLAELKALGENQEAERMLNLGGGAGKALSFVGSEFENDFHWIRGEVFFQENNLGNPEFNKFELKQRLRIASADEVFIETKSLGFLYDQSGDFTISGEGIYANMFGYEIQDADILLTISTAPGNFALQGGVTYNDGLQFEALELETVSGLFGAGEQLLYIGISGDGSINLSGDPAKIGASLLVGKINQSSVPALNNLGFEELVQRIDLSEPKVGAYVRALGTVPIIGDGCALSLKVGGELEFWYFAGDTDDYGGSLRGFAYGKALCVISARGDVTLEYRQVSNPEVGQVFEGEGWVAGGTGFDCDPGDWGPNWSGRWWDDDWCWQAGAAATIRWASWEDSWQYSLDADYE